MVLLAWFDHCGWGEEKCWLDERQGAVWTLNPLSERGFFFCGHSKHWLYRIRLEESPDLCPCCNHPLKRYYSGAMPSCYSIWWGALAVVANRKAASTIHAKHYCGSRYMPFGKRKHGSRYSDKSGVDSPMQRNALFCLVPSKIVIESNTDQWILMLFPAIRLIVIEALTCESSKGINFFLFHLKLYFPTLHGYQLNSMVTQWNDHCWNMEIFNDLGPTWYWFWGNSCQAMDNLWSVSHITGPWQPLHCWSNVLVSVYNDVWAAWDRFKKIYFWQPSLVWLTHSSHNDDVPNVYIVFIVIVRHRSCFSAKHLACYLLIAGQQHYLQDAFRKRSVCF